MPSGPGYIDANGSYRYGEADNPDGTFSGLLELGQDAESTKFAAIDAAIAAGDAALDTRLDALEVVDFARRSSAAAITWPTVVAKAAWPTAVDTDTEITYATGDFTCTRGGIYRVRATIGAAATSGGLSIYLYVNGASVVERRGIAVAGTGSAAPDLDETLRLAANDVVAIYTIGSVLNAGVADAKLNQVSIFLEAA